MSHSSGISVSKELLEKFAAAREGGAIRWIKAVIDLDAELVNFVCEAQFGSSFQSDFESVQPQLQHKEPCYVLFRLEDASNPASSNFQRWLLMTYAPDVALIKAKMLIASTRDNAKKQLGLNYFAMEMYGSTPADLSYAEYENILSSRKTDAPLTAAEVVFRSEAVAEVHHGIQREYVHSVQFPMDKKALSEMDKLKSGSITFVQVQVDPEKETIDYVKSSSSGVGDLPHLIPSDSPSFSLFRWKYNFEGSARDAYVFVYCCPSNSKVKLKMLYSTVNKAAISAIEGAGIKITKKVEVETPGELTEKELLDELHPEAAAAKKASPARFSKPQRPGKGRARMTRS
eukprot:CAMPEP_0201475920 /NCGR_PEP_ID=MMETSP0151_2-20130828/1233_1 /ASSEMBLY_ACC=CAM_ASM_000257 /TAXON_ID=200890 /ORGANISM="Paramoeba atlantica, Strain 621/1 / CCAP 1560/9" /LENGTH=343 /DNA_ID=CAMNT_0047856133 /DNA_START=27 /DNA_END=1058 /DNA_ORIENTATION=-